MNELKVRILRNVSMASIPSSGEKCSLGSLMIGSELKPSFESDSSGWSFLASLVAAVDSCLMDFWCENCRPS